MGQAMGPSGSDPRTTRRLVMDHGVLGQDAVSSASNPRKLPTDQNVLHPRICNSLCRLAALQGS